MPKVGKNQRKILLMLQAGIALALSGSPKAYFWVLKKARREWERINDEALRESIRALYRSKLVDARDHPDGSVTMVLSENGRKRAMLYNISEMKISKPEQWDKKWRIILFDIPEKIKKARDALRHSLLSLGCHEYQKSVFVHPFECRDEIDFVIEFYQVRPFVRFIVADYLDNALHIKQKFRL